MRSRGRTLAATAIAGAATAGLLALAPAAPTMASTPGSTPTPTTGSVPGPVVGGDRLGQVGVQQDLPAGVPAPHPPTAAAWLVADLNTRAVLVASRVHEPLAPASTLKIFTALALGPGLDPGTVYTAVDADAAEDGTKVGLVPGSRYTVDDLLHGMLMGSGNDCAHAVGQLAGGQDAAVRRMQRQATSLGALDTVVRNTSGLDAKGQVSSAYDLALAGSAALQNPRLARVMHTTAYAFPGKGKWIGHGRSHFQIQNHNRLLRNLPGATGVKNGYTVHARGSFVGSATRGGRSYLVVVLRAKGSTWHESADLLQWAFRYGDRAGPVGSLVRPGAVAAGDAAAGPAVTPLPAVAHLSGARPAPARRPRGDDVLLGTGVALVLSALLAGAAAARSGRRRRRDTPGRYSRYPEPW